MLETFLQTLSNIPWTEIYLYYLGFSAILYFGKSSLDNFTLIKDSKEKKKKIIVFPTEVINKCREYDDSQLNKELQSASRDFYYTLKNNVDNSLLSNFENNIRSLTVDKMKHSFSNILKAGSYSASYNTISLKGKLNREVFFHELLHMASFHRESNKMFTGFYQYSYGENVGEALNEGYTELLNQDIFKTKKANKIYQYMVDVCRVIEEVVGKENMIKYYFQSDLASLTKDILKYISQDDCRSLFSDTDYLLNCFRQLQSGITFPYNQFKFNNINRILTNMYTNKLISENQYTAQNIDKYNELLPKSFKSMFGIYFIKNNFGNNTDILDNSEKRL